MTALKEILLERIAIQGPLSVAEYMQECLLHPQHGYYATRDPLGVAGDFITAPEISQMFGEMIGLTLAQAWLDQGSPEVFVLAEAGPGRGTLMADILRATRAVPGFGAAVQVHLIEASPVLRAKQREALGADVTWHDEVDQLPELPLFFVANEFFDALPVRQFVRDGEAWRERQVGAQDGVLVWGLGAAAAQPALAHRIEDTKDGDLVEHCAAFAPTIATISTKIEAYGGAGLVIDYGDWRSLGDTLQAVRAHEAQDVLATPGCADLTTHVDFEVLAQAAVCSHSRVTPQGVFLERLGITARAETLAKSLSGEALGAHVAAHQRLTHPHEMGNLFKVLALFPSTAPCPAGCTT